MICTFKPCNAVSDEKTMCCLEGLQHINTIHKHVFMYCVYSIGAVLVFFFFFWFNLNEQYMCKREGKKGEKTSDTSIKRTPEKSSNQEANKNSSVGGLWLCGDLGLSLVDIC